MIAGPGHLSRRRRRRTDGAPRADLLRVATRAMGTRFELAIMDERPARWRAVAEAAIDEIEECHRRLSRFAADSLLSHINRTAAAAPVRLDVETYALFEDALAVQRASGGAFDITAGTAVNEVGFDRRSAVILDPLAHTIRLAGPRVALDLGGIAKGHALDLAARIFRAHGVRCALLHGGTSSVVAIGAPPGESGSRIAIGRGAGAPTIVLRDRALSVSSPSGRTFAVGTERLSHIIDPRSGEPVRAARLAAVIGPTARLADAWSTALVVLGARPPALGDEWTVVLREVAAEP